MALSDAQIYNGDGSTRDFTILGEILSESHLRVWIDDVLQSSDDWDLLGNTVLFNDAPDDGANVQFLVSTTGTDFPSNPSAIGDVSININDVITVAANLGIINTVSTNINDVIVVSNNIDNVNDVASNKTNIDNVANNKTNIDTVANNISKVTTVADDTVAINEIYNNRLEIYEAANNALIATNKASEASTSASNAQLSVWEAEAEAMTSESYATEAVDVFVKEYTSNGDGTFTATNTTDYSSFHWAEKSKDSAQGEAVNISYDNSGSGFTSTNVQDVLDEVDVTKMNKNINALTNKTTPVDADEMVIADSTSSFSLKKLSFSNLKDNIVEVGTTRLVPVSTVPTGYLEMNGALLSRTAYSKLFAYLGTTYGAGDGSTTFALPDTRGEFIRGWDNGRGIDISRTIGSSQADLLKSHSHTLIGYGRTQFDTTGGNLFHGMDSPASGTSNALSFPASGGGTETRPRNIAMMYCIKY